MLLSDYISELRSKSVTVIGVGTSNTPLIELLCREGVSVLARDRRSREDFGPEYDRLAALGARFKLGPDYMRDITEDVVFKTPGVRPDVPELAAAREKGSLITSEMEMFFEVCPCPIIAITGSDGKTTTTTLVAELLSAAGYRVHLGGNIGTPLVDKVPEIDSSDYAVVELSSFQLMTMTKSADVAVVTNVSPNHLDYHTGMDEYIEAKKNVFSHQGRDGLLVVNADNETAFGFAAQASGAVRTFSRRAEQANGCWFDGEKIYFCENGEKTILIDKSEVALRGLHNIENLMAAFCAVVDFVGIDMCRRVARQFSGVEHRLEPVREVGGVMYYNDSIASSPTRTIAGLESFDRKLILIAGGYDKHLDYSSLGMAIRDRVKTLVLLGATAPKIKEAVLAAKNGAQPEILEATDMEGAVKLAASRAADGDIVILSPASASFDMFKNFEERGNCFKNIVLAL